MHVRPTDGSAERERISSKGGFLPPWSPDGKDVYDRRSSITIMAAAVEPGPPLPVRSPRVILEMEVLQSISNPWDIMPDGQRFVMTRNMAMPSGASLQPVLVLNWSEELREKLGGP